MDACLGRQSTASVHVQVSDGDVHGGGDDDDGLDGLAKRGGGWMGE